jgi:hypothetical protein
VHNIEIIIIYTHKTISNLRCSNFLVVVPDGIRQVCQPRTNKSAELFTKFLVRRVTYYGKNDRKITKMSISILNFLERKMCKSLETYIGVVYMYVVYIVLI